MKNTQELTVESLSVDDYGMITVIARGRSNDIVVNELCFIVRPESAPSIGKPITLTIEYPDQQ